jgi:serine/threonine protein kinase
MGSALAAGTTIGGFDVLSVLGRGGFGITYRAIDQASQQTYAIKEYLPDGISNRAQHGRVTALRGQEDTFSRGLQAFMTEANILKDLPRRKGLVRVRGAFEKSGTAYCVMEFIEGDSLDRMAQRVIQRQGYVAANMVTDLGVAMAWALDALHAQRLIHRDVKPANIMLRKSGDPVLIDFGAARRLTRRGAKDTIFTRKYAAIEQFPPEMTGFGRMFDEGPWSDLYSLSVVLYELIANMPPPEATQRAKAVLNGRPDPFIPLAQVVEGQGRQVQFPASVLAAIDAGCALLPKERISDAKTFAERLQPGVWAALQAEYTARTADGSDRTQTARRAPQGPPTLVLVVLLLGTIAAILGWLYYSYYYVEVF